VTLRSRAIGAGIHAYLEGRRSKRAVYEALRVLRGGIRRLDFYYRADDPYSHLLAQVLPEVVRDYRLEVSVIPVASPPIAAHPEPTMLTSHGLRDAVVLAEAYGLSFPERTEPALESCVQRAHAVLLKPRPTLEQLEVAIRLGEAVWRDDTGEVDRVAQREGAEPDAKVGDRLRDNYRRLERAGHYQPGMLHYQGEWYWGIDRLSHLLHRLRDEGLDGRSELLARAPKSLVAQLAAHSGRPRLTVFFSFRSPYSYLSLPQLERMHHEGLVELELRPVLPMVMRGFTVPLAKRLYIVHDAKREADRLGIPFGRICDPLGEGIANCFSVFHRFAAPAGRELPFSMSVMKGIWSEAKDVSAVRDLRQLAVRAGLPASGLDEALDDDAWRARAAANREALTQLGFWGVPSVRIGAFSTWGQDRLPLIRAALREAKGKTHGVSG